LKGRELINVGHSIQLNELVTANNPAILKGGNLRGEYKFLQYHVHTPSEHTIDGISYPLEVHLVHINTDEKQAKQDNQNELAVIGLLFKEGNENIALKSFFDNLSSIKTVKSKTTIDTDLSSLIPSNDAYYSYAGSLTTPNCRETVTWHVMKQIQEISKAQLQLLRSVLNNEPINRPVQKLNGRHIRTNSPPKSPNFRRIIKRVQQLMTEKAF